MIHILPFKAVGNSIVLQLKWEFFYGGLRSVARPFMLLYDYLYNLA